MRGLRKEPWCGINVGERFVGEGEGRLTCHLLIYLKVHIPICYLCLTNEATY
jgi:hypothetical protein